MDDIPFLDLAAPGFSTRSEAVLAARARSWCARTPYGLAVLRHRPAGLLLRDRRLRQGSHAWPAMQGLAGEFAEFWRRSVIAQEGARHAMLRRIAQAALSGEFVLSLKGRFGADAGALVDGLRDRGAFDFVAEVSEPFAGRAIAAILGLGPDAAPAIARDASTLGLAMGFGAKAHEAGVNAASFRLAALAERLIARARRSEDRESCVARLVRASAEAGVADDQALVDLVVISIFGGVDTTRAQLGFAAALFARHPDQWHWLRDHPEAVPGAIDEVIRAWPATTWATREALEDFDFEGVRIARGMQVQVLVHATATDPLLGPWEGFDIRAARKIHFGFGGGAHHCLGQFVARTDMAAALGVLLENWREIRLAGKPDFMPDSGNTSPTRLPVAPVWA